MPEFDRLDGSSIVIELDFVEREQTPLKLMELSIQLLLCESSLLDTISILEYLVSNGRARLFTIGSKRPTYSRQTVPSRIISCSTRTVIHLDDQRYWLYVAVDSETNKCLHARLFPTRNEGVTSIFLSELTKKHDVDDAVFLVDSGPWLKAARNRHGLRFRHETHGNRNAVEHLFQKVKRRTYQLGNCFRNAEPNIAETWLQRYAYVWNQRN